MAIRRCGDPQALEQALAHCREAGEEALFLFFGSEDPVSGVSWCPDCVTADPLLRTACGLLRPEVVLHECPVGTRGEWRDRSEHPYRQHPVWHLERIPTLVHLRGHCELGRLVEADCGDDVCLARFLGAG